ncbi:MAG: class I lanthipeptide [Hyphomicrobiales bacterium]
MKKKLNFKKETIATLDNLDLKSINGGGITKACNTNQPGCSIMYTVQEDACAITRGCYTTWTCHGPCRPSVMAEDCLSGPTCVVNTTDTVSSIVVTR